MGAAASLNKKANDLLPPCIHEMRALHKVRADEARARLVLQKATAAREAAERALRLHVEKDQIDAIEERRLRAQSFYFKKTGLRTRVEGWQDPKVMLFYGKKDVHDVYLGPNGIGKFTRKGFGQPYVYTF